MSAIDLVLETLVENPNQHMHSSALYRLLKATARSAVQELFSSTERVDQPFGPFGEISMPFTKMGNINSLDLFGIDELIIFAFYNANRTRYRNVIDIGANLGLHSIILSRCGFNVHAFEPDPWHYEMLITNLSANETTVTTFKEAVSVKDGVAQFVRVLGNTTGSHLAGAKDSYGEKEIFNVPIRAVTPLFESADFVKIDAEGHEKELLKSLSIEQLNHIDIMVEVGNPENAEEIYKYFKSIGGKMFAQKIGWARVTKIEDIPTSHREGSLFITSKELMPWN
jgi:FkbM family methyltransferase